MDINQVRYLFKKAIKSSAAVTNLVGDRIFPQHFQSVDAVPPNYPLVVFSSLGGDTAYFKTLSTLQFEVYCYSKVNASEAYALSNAVYNSLQEIRLAENGITARGLVRQLDGGAEAYNDDIDAYYIRSTYEVKAVL